MIFWLMYYYDISRYISIDNLNGDTKKQCNINASIKQKCNLKKFNLWATKFL